VGATLFTLLLGRPVHVGENAAQVLVHAATNRARSVTSIAPEVPPAIADVIDRALSFEKASRWATAASMRAALTSACLEALGERPSRAVLVPLVAQHQASNGADWALSSTAAADSDATGVAPTLAAVTERARAVSYPESAVVGGSTARPVSSQPTRSPRTTVATVANAALAVALIAMGLVFRAEHRRVPSTTLSYGAPVASGSALTPAPTMTPARPFEPWVPAPVSSSLSPPPPIPSAPSAPVKVVKPAMKPLPATPPAVAPSCDPPTWTDELHHVHLKQGCN
jgi:eukaryotic-like serine/threonine-protein kinase